MPEIVLKQLADVEIRKKDEGRKMTFVASDGTRDSAGTVLNQSGWDLTRFNKNGIIGYQHKVYGGFDDTDNPDNIIGKGFAYVEDGKLMVDVEFEPEGMNELADKVYKKLQFGTLKAVSVGFLPLKGEDGKYGEYGKGEESINGSKPTYYYRAQQLLEVSVVNIPANPNALKKSVFTESEEAEAARIKAECEAPKVEVAPEGNELALDANKLEQDAIETRSRELLIATTIAGASLALKSNK